MKALFVTWWADVRQSYWFIPSIMAVAAIVLSFLTTAVDSTLGSEWLENISWLYANKPAGARAVLSTVAGSMITVAGVTFSMTILSISHTTSQVGPRLLNNFMRDTGNQITLGVFISTFLYCLMVLRTVRNADSPTPGSTSNAELASAFVPHIAVMVGLLLAISSVGVLIYFIHHIPESIHISNIVAGVGRDLNDRIEERFPSQIGEPHEEESERSSEANLPDSFYSAATPLRSDRSGYVEYIDTDTLMNLARDHDLILRMHFRAGDFVTPASVLLRAAPESRVDDDVKRMLAACYVSGAQRTSTQDLRFVINQLVEVAMRALSPGVNDPFTAMNCMNWLQSALETLAERKLPAAHRFDDEQNLRIVAEPETFASFAAIVFDQLRPYVAADRNAAIHMMEMLVNIGVSASSLSRRRVLVRHASRLRKICNATLTDRDDLKIITSRYRSLIRLLRDSDYRNHLLRTGDWIAGRA